MKDNRRIAAGVALYNSPSGWLIADVRDFDGGDFELHPKVTDDGALILVDPQRPAGYGLEIRGDADALVRLGAALQRIGRDARNNDGDTDTDAE